MRPTTYTGGPELLSRQIMHIDALSDGPEQGPKTSLILPPMPLPHSQSQSQSSRQRPSRLTAHEEPARSSHHPVP